MTVYVAFNEHHDGPAGASLGTVTPVTGTRIRSHVRAGMQIAGAEIYSVPFGAALTEGWASVVYGSPSDYSLGNLTRNIFDLRLNTGATICALRRNSDTTGAMAIFNAVDGTTTTVATYSTATAVKFDIWFRVHPTAGFIRVFVNGSQVYAFDGNTALGGAVSVDSLRYASAASSTSSRFDSWSEILVSDQSTIGSKVITRAFTAFGDINQWAGAITDINAATDTDATFMSELTPGDDLLLASAAIPTLAVGDVISAVFLNFRANAESTSPVTRLAPLARRAGVTNAASPISLGATAAPYQFKWELDPFTGAPWSEANVNATQFGWEAQA